VLVTSYIAILILFAFMLLRVPFEPLILISDPAWGLAHQFLWDSCSSVGDGIVWWGWLYCWFMIACCVAGRAGWRANLLRTGQFPSSKFPGFLAPFFLTRAYLGTKERAVLRDGCIFHSPPAAGTFSADQQSVHCDVLPLGVVCKESRKPIRDRPGSV